jgi:hypothetical protein
VAKLLINYGVSLEEGFPQSVALTEPFDIAQLLLEHGADPNVMDKNIRIVVYTAQLKKEANSWLNYCSVMEEIQNLMMQMTKRHATTHVLAQICSDDGFRETWHQLLLRRRPWKNGPPPNIILME